VTLRTVFKQHARTQTVLANQQGWRSLLLFALLGCSLLAGFAGFSSKAQAADAIAGEQWCDRLVSRVLFSGNRVTRDHVIRRELVQSAGSPCSLDDVIDGIQNILDLGLFKSVRAELSINAQALELTYIVVEKIYFLPIPRFSRTSDGELRYGGQLRWDNFLGQLHQLKLTSEKRQEDDGRGRTGYVSRLEYTVPRFFGSRYGMQLNAGSERRNAELSQDDVVYGEARRESRNLEWRLARWANQSTGVQGLSYFAGFGLEQRQYELQSGTAGPYTDGENAFVMAGFDIRNVHQDTYRRRGTQQSVVARLAQQVLGADFSYARVDTQMRWYIPLQNPQANLNIQWRLGLSSSAPFGERSYSIGGGDVMRGMRTGTATGDILTLLNLEYLSGFFSYPEWRWLVFSDIGNVYRDNKVDLTDQHVRLGAGLRWKLTAITNTDIRLDVAWDPGRQKFTPYVSTSLTF